MRNIFTCSTLLLGVACYAHMVCAMEDMEALTAMKSMDGIEIYSYPSPDDCQQYSSMAKLGWHRFYQQNIQQQRQKCIGHEGSIEPEKDRIFTNTFTNDFDEFFKTHTGRNISNKVRQFLLQNSFGNRINIVNIVEALSSNDSCRAFCDDDDIAKTIKELMANGKIKCQERVAYNLVTSLNDNDPIGVDEVTLGKIRAAIVARNTFVEILSNCIYKNAQYEEKIKEEFGNKCNPLNEDRDLVGDLIKTTDLDGSLEDRQALRKFLGYKAFFNIDYANDSCSLNGALAGLEEFVKYDVNSFRLYVDITGLINEIYFDENGSDKVKAVEEFILCYHQYLYEELCLSERVRDTFAHRINSENYFPYERAGLESVDVSPDDISSLVANGNKMKRINTIFEKLSGKAQGLSDESIGRIYANGIKVALGMNVNTTASPEEIGTYGNTMHAQFLASSRTTAPTSGPMEIYTFFAQVVSKLDSKGFDFLRVFNKAYDLISHISTLNLGNGDMIRYLFESLNKEINSQNRSSQFIAENVGYLTQDFNNCDNAQTRAIVRCSNAFVERDPRITQANDKLDACLSNIINGIFNDVFSFRLEDRRSYGEEPVAQMNVLKMLNGQFGLTIPHVTRYEKHNKPEGLFYYFKVIENSDNFAKRIFEKLPAGLLNENSFRNEGTFEAIVQMLAQNAFSPEVLVQKLVESISFQNIAEAFVREISHNDNALINWGRLDERQKQQIAIDMLMHYGYADSPA
ncbi:hypothetical protein FACS1894122_02520 [Alphaproteobacteria bacterium]|nr:hypothetical protein FACS1894122_02520 [Alphaproteobacteria bacterium]